MAELLHNEYEKLVAYKNFFLEGNPPILSAFKATTFFLSFLLLFLLLLIHLAYFWHGMFLSAY